MIEEDFYFIPGVFGVEGVYFLGYDAWTTGRVRDLESAIDRAKNQHS